MTKDEWEACDDPLKLIQFARSFIGTREMRLHAVAACRRCWRQLPDPNCCGVIEAAEAWADSEVTEREVRAQMNILTAGIPQRRIGREQWSETQLRLAMASFLTGSRSKRGLTECIIHVLSALYPDQVWPVCDTVQSDIFRDIAGDLYVSSQTLSPISYSKAARLMAEEMYVSRDFEQMPGLATQLQTDGVIVPEIMEHCRSSRLHVRGCWVLDRITERRSNRRLKTRE